MAIYEITSHRTKAKASQTSHLGWWHSKAVLLQLNCCWWGGCHRCGGGGGKQVLRLPAAYGRHGWHDMWPQNTYIYRVPQCMSPRRNWDSPTPSRASEWVPLPPEPGGGGANSPAGEGLGESQFRRLEKKLSILPTLCMWHSSFVKNLHLYYNST